MKKQVKKRDKKELSTMETARDAFKNSRALLEEGRELRKKLKERLEPITKVGDKEIRFRLK